MTATAMKLKPKVIIPTLKERMIALVDELLTAPSQDQIATLEAIDQTLSDAADALAEARRPKGERSAIPVGWMRQEMSLRGREHLPGARAYLAAIKTNA
jgi:hypothetical protein